MPLAVQRRAHAAAAVVPADDDVADLQHVDRELDHREAVEVGVHDHVRDVAVDEELARQQADDLVGRHAAVGAADPQVLGRLLARKLGEELRVLLAGLRSAQARLFSKRCAKIGHGIEDSSVHKNDSFAKHYYAFRKRPRPSTPAQRAGCTGGRCRVDSSRVATIGAKPRRAAGRFRQPPPRSTRAISLRSKHAERSSLSQPRALAQGLRAGRIFFARADRAIL